jgi:tetratricopeptide (TPR) repeat protein
MAARRASLVLAILTAVVTLYSCAREDPRVRAMVDLEPYPPSSGRIEELQAVVAQHGETVSRKVEAGLKQADALKLLGQEYLRHDLYGPALDVLEDAIVIQPRNHVLHYLAGASAGHIGKAQARGELRAAYLERAEHSYLRAVDLAPDYIDGLYALAVLYVFELDRPFDAIPHLNRVLDRSAAHVPSLFVLARAYLALDNVDEAIAAYDRIIASGVDVETRRNAERNRRLLVGGSL